MTWPPLRTLVIAAAIAIVLLAAAAGGWYWYDAQQRRVGAAYAEVMARAYAANNPQAPADAKTRAQQDIERLLAQHHSAGILSQQVQQTELPGRQLDKNAVAAQLAAGIVQFEAAKAHT